MGPLSLAILLAAAPTVEPCAYDRVAMLALDQRAFDQDLRGGWRVLARDTRCMAMAADLIRDYREAHGLTTTILYWHEGQMRAEAGQYEEAIALFDRARHAEPDEIGWNHYVDASIAFLRRDLPALRRARTALAAVRRPPGFAPVDVHGSPANIIWPLNLNVVDALLTCFGQSYALAYRCSRPNTHRTGH